MGGAGAALPDRARAANFNPGLPGLSFPRNRTAISLHPSWGDSFGGKMRFKDWNTPLFPEEKRFWFSLAAVPAAYFPKVGFIGLDRQAAALDWSRYRETKYALTFSAAPDLMAGREGKKDSGFQWTGGISLNYLELENTRFVGVDWEPHPAIDRGYSIDVGWAWRIPKLPFLPGLGATAGLSFLNLGPSFQQKGMEYQGTADPLDQRYLAGWSLEYRPWRQAGFASRKWTPGRILVTQDFRKDFPPRYHHGEPEPFPAAFFHDFGNGPMRYWRELKMNVGAELTVMEMFHLRGGRGHSSFQFSEPTYAFGYGFASGPLLGRCFLNFDYGRILSMGAAIDKAYFEYPSTRQYGLLAGILF